MIGLTGNIATGKSLVGHMLAERGAEHIDADRLAHQVVARGTDAWEQIVREFGREILRPDGEIDRARLGAIVFSDAAALARLEGFVHPPVIALTGERIERSTASIVVVEAIKLIESGMVVRLCDALWVVIAPRAAQLELRGCCCSCRRSASAVCQGSTRGRRDRQWRIDRGHSTPGSAGMGGT